VLCSLALVSTPAGEKSGGIVYWLRKRRLSYIVARLGRLLRRYGVTASKAKRRTLRFVRLLARYDCAPTLATPGMVVAKHPRFMRELRDAGVELALHGFDHLDFRGLTQADAQRQLTRAASAYTDAGIPFTGFRCPYLSYSHDMSSFVPEGLVEYSSNEAVWWDVATGVSDKRNATFDSLVEFYRATSSQASLVLPRTVERLVEIPVSLPDDLQLLDGLESGDAGVRDAWIDLLGRSHERGSVFVVLFHPESFDLCAGALEGLLAEARRLEPAVWIARLGDIAAWWRELATFSAHVRGSAIEFDCSDRALVLARGLEPATGPEWTNGYRIAARTLDFTRGPLPFVGAPADVPAERVATLRGLGYVVEQGEAAGDCAVRLDADVVARRSGDRELVELVEQTDGPLVRFWHWPQGVRSALSITGDLDALSLGDYASRLFALIRP
jgi:peptidoglycan/xylan/chitin deacetylase (PgdA/CDA1 family)